MYSADPKKVEQARLAASRDAGYPGRYRAFKDYDPSTGLAPQRTRARPHTARHRREIISPKLSVNDPSRRPQFNVPKSNLSSINVHKPVHRKTTPIVKATAAQVWGVRDTIEPCDWGDPW